MFSPILIRLLLLMVFSLCTACSTSRIVPQPTATAVLDQSGLSLTEEHEGTAITVSIGDLPIRSVQTEQNIQSFHLAIENRSAQPVTIHPDSIILRGFNGSQFKAISADQARELLSKDTAYLLPYPFVGYYYMEDQARVVFNNELTSNLPYYAEFNPREMVARALPSGPVLPQSKSSGSVFFLADLVSSGGAELLIYRDARLQGQPQFRFPFVVEK